MSCHRMCSARCCIYLSCCPSELGPSLLLPRALDLELGLPSVLQALCWLQASVRRSKRCCVLLFDNLCEKSFFFFFSVGTVYIVNKIDKGKHWICVLSVPFLKRNKSERVAQKSRWFWLDGGDEFCKIQLNHVKNDIHNVSRLGQRVNTEFCSNS